MAGTPKAASLSTPRKIGPYRVTLRLGAGGMGEVYKGYDDRLERPVALKRLFPESRPSKGARARFHSEARAVARLHHPAIVQVFDWVETPDGDWIVMELIEGRGLKRLLENGPLPPEVAAHFARQIASGLIAAHGAGIIHRDLKASNMMVVADDGGDQIKILDFGIAKHLSPRPGAEYEGLTTEGHILGTASAMSPEQAMGRNIDHRSDLFSLGTLFYLMTTGLRPFDGPSPVKVMSRICTWDPTPAAEVNPRVPAVLSSLIGDLLEKDPAHRPQSAREVVERLSEFFYSRGAPPASAASETSQAITLPHPGVGLEPPKKGASTVAMPTRPRPTFKRTLALLALAILVLGFGGWLRQRVGKNSGLADIHSVVAMPSRLEGLFGEDFLTDAIPTTLSTHLGQDQGLEVKLPPTGLDVERVGGDLARIAEIYGADALILTSVAVEAGSLVLNLQLVAATSRSVLWSHEYTGPRSAHLALARQAAMGVRKALNPSLLVPDPPIGSPTASQAELLFLQGRYHANLYRNLGRPGDRERALAALKGCLDLDPERADAAAEIAMVLAAGINTGTALEEVKTEVVTWAHKALDLDPHTSRAWAALGAMQGLGAESFDKKLEYSLRAAAFGPQDGYAHSRLTVPLGTSSKELALVAARQATLIDPLVLTSRVFEAVLLLKLDRHSEALERVNSALEIEPDMPYGLYIRAWLLTRTNRETEAMDLVRQHLEALTETDKLHPLWVTLLRDLATFSLAVRQGDAVAADAATRRLESLARGEKPFPSWVALTGEVAAHLAQHGRIEAAVDLLRFRGRLGYVESYDLLVFRPAFEPIRDDPGFQEVLEMSRARFEHMKKILEQVRQAHELPTYLELPLARWLARIDQAEKAG